MVYITLSQALAALSVVRLASAVIPLGPIAKNNAMMLFKRQGTCLGPVICEQTANSCTSCEAGFYCVQDDLGGCCPIGRNCGGFKPCVNAGTEADPIATQICPTAAPLCTVISATPACAGSFQDWITLSEALQGAPTTVPTTSTTPPAVEPTTSTSTSTVEVPTYTYEPPTSTVSTEMPTYTYEPPSVSTEAPPSTTYVPPPPRAYNTTIVEPPVATGAAVRNQLGLRAVAGFVFLAVFAF